MSPPYRPKFAAPVELAKVYEREAARMRRRNRGTINRVIAARRRYGWPQNLIPQPEPPPRR
jgi:hypothetical protein